MIKLLIGGSPCTHWSIAQHNGREKEASGNGGEQVTIKEANEAARQLLPVIFDGMEFERITQVGINYNEKGEPRYFLQILGKNHGSVVYVEPRSSEVKRPN